MRFIHLVLAVLAALILGACDPRPAAPTAAAPAGGDLLAKVRAAGVMRVGVKADAPPFGMRRGGTLVGFDIDLAHAIAARLGIAKVELVPVNSDERSDRLVAGEVDCVIASMTITRYRERRVDFSIPYFQDGAAFLVKADSPIQSYMELAGRAVGCVKGSSSSYYLTQVAPDAKRELVPGFNDLRAALDAGTVEAVMSDRLLLIGLMQQADAKDRYRIAGANVTVEPYGIAVPQNQSAWRNAINHALCELWEGGEWRQIADTWFGPGTPYEGQADFALPVYPR
ncbi:MAG: transporter substrate-binding domain-containing protein [Planctomycetes bacterium]|nr:transporter substrate-binding domain-containing protein [Planctomycetota bacterium]